MIQPAILVVVIGKANCHLIIAYEDGRNPDKIHMHLDVSQRTIKRWIKNYLKAGVDGLKDHSRSGRPPKVDKEKLGEIGEIIKKDNQRVWGRKTYLLLNFKYVIYCVLRKIYSRTYEENQL